MDAKDRRITKLERLQKAALDEIERQKTEAADFNARSTATQKKTVKAMMLVHFIQRR